MKKFFLFFLICIPIYAQTTLSAGDIAVIGINCDDAFPAQRWAFAALIDIEQNTVIQFTDASFDNSLSGNKFYINSTNEGFMTWTVPSAIDEGTTFIVTNNNAGNATIRDIANNVYSGVSGSLGGSSFGFTGTGDQIIVYQGTSGTTVGATFVYALNNGQSATNYTSNGAWMTSGTVSAQNLSYLPNGLTNGTSAAGLTSTGTSGGGTTYGYDNMRYNGTTTTANKAAMLSAIGDPAKWIGDNSTPYDFSTIGNLTLPVELTSFTAAANGNTVELRWQTASERNNYGFEIQRQDKSIEWNTIAFIEGHGNSSSPKNYFFTDLPADGKSFKYRLKQMDFDGKYEYSAEVEAELVVSSFYVKQNYPNPFNPSTKIEYSIPADCDVEIKIFNALGAEVAVLLKGYKQAGTYNIKFNASDFPSGIYYYRIISGSNSEVKKMILLR